MKKLMLFFVILSFCTVVLTSCAVGAAIGKNVTAHVQQNDSVTSVVNLQIPQK